MIRAKPHASVGRFQIEYQGELIGDTDGLEVVSAAIGSQFPEGMLVVQDGFIRLGGPDGAQNQTGQRRYQRFAFVSWADIADALDPSRKPSNR